jgi:hypothetical protein
MNEIFFSFLNNDASSYKLKNASEKQIELYQKAYKKFKLNNSETKAVILLDLENNTILMNHFTGLDMYKFGYEVAKSE